MKSAYSVRKLRFFPFFSRSCNSFTVWIRVLKEKVAVSWLNGTLQPAGGTIRQRPNASASARIDAMYCSGSLNSSGVGWYTGASFTAARRYFGGMAASRRGLNPASAVLRTSAKSSLVVKASSLAKAWRGKFPTSLARPSSHDNWYSFF